MATPAVSDRVGLSWVLQGRLVREEPDEVESLTSGFEAESGEAIPRLRLTVHLLLQVRTKVLDGDWRETFERWYPELATQAA